MNIYRSALLVACCFLAVGLSPTAAQGQPGSSSEVATPAAGPNVSSSCGAGPLDIVGIQSPLPMSPCFVSVECSDGSTVSCNGNSSCSTSGPSDRCVTCDGVQVACCALTACEQCDLNYDNCIWNCEFPFECARCDRIYDRCLAVHNCN